MSDLFMIYEDSLSLVLKKIGKIIESMTNLSKEKTENAWNEAHTNLQEANRILRQMELEVESGKNHSSNSGLKSKVNSYKNEVEMNRKQFMKLQENYINKKSQDALMIVENYSGGKNSQRDNWIENENAYHANTIEKGDVEGKKIELISVGENNDYSDPRKDEIFKMNKQSLLGRMINPRNRKNMIIAGIAILVLWIVIVLCKILL